MKALRGLYVITDAGLLPGAALLPAVADAIAGGARAVQYRDKGNNARQRRDQAAALAGLCHAQDVLLIVNDDVELAVQVSAHGVHLGREDGAIATARRRLGPGAVIGASCYDRLELASRAAAAGADYVAFGSFHHSQIKPGAVRATPDLLRRARAELALPVVAIGGITPENGASLVAAGADMLAVISAVFGADDIRAAAQAFQPAFRPAQTEST